MRTWTCRLAIAVGLAVLFLPRARGDEPTAVSFKDQVAPLLVRKCLGCHNATKAENGLDLSTFARLRKGGKSEGETIIEPGDPEASGLIASVRPDATPRMPLKQAPLSPAEIGLLERWVKAGARFDGPSETETPIASLVDPLRNLPKVVPRGPVVEPVAAVLFAKDGSSLFAAVGKAILRVAPDGKAPPRLFARRPGPINALLLSPDGKHLIAVGGRPGMSGEIAAWDIDRGSLLFEWKGHTDAVLTAALSPDGRRLATTGIDRVVLVWDLEARRLAHRLTDHTDAVYALAFSPDGATLASAGADRTVRLWSVASGTKRATLSDATGELNALTFAPDGATLFGAGGDRMIRAWDLRGEAPTQRASVFAHQAPVLRLALVPAPTGSLLISAGEDREVRLWDSATLQSRQVTLGQPDWPQSLAVDQAGKQLAVGRHDGTISLVDLTNPAKSSLLTTTLAPPASASTSPSKPRLVRNASLNPPTPRAVRRGSTARLTLTGQGVGRATEVFADEPGLVARIVEAPKADAGRLLVELEIAADARPGVHRLGVVTPIGVPPATTFLVETHPEWAEQEPNDRPDQARAAPLPCVVSGAIGTSGDVDHVALDVEPGKVLVVRSTAGAIGSPLRPRLTLLDGRGRVVAESTPDPTGREVAVTHAPETKGAVILRVEDLDYGGSAGHIYRLAASVEPWVSGVFPLAVTRGATADVQLAGVNLGRVQSASVHADRSVEPGTILPVVARVDGPGQVLGRPLLVVADGPQLVERDATADETKPMVLPIPGGISGRVARPGEVDRYAFAGRRGQPVIFEVFGSRLGTPIDSVVEVVDARGRAVPRALLRVLAETEVAFRDHDASKPGIRLTRWDQLAVNDTVVIGREVTRIFALPRNPDDDCLFWSEGGRRVGVLETTPEHHPMGQPVWKVEVHPPDATLPTEGQPPIVLPCRNDDGAPTLGRDSLLTFDPPVDGNYEVRVTDARGLGGPGFTYHLVARRPRPDFRVALAASDVNIPRGGTALVPMTLTRLDGYSASVEITAVDLPPGITCTPAVVEAEALTAQLALTAAADAPMFSPPGWSIRARALPRHGQSADSAAPSSAHPVDGGGPRGGRIVVVEARNLVVRSDREQVVLRPGESTRLTLSVERGPGFAGRVPIDVRNLPQGVRVLDVGLNGVLVTEAQTARTIVLQAEHWATPTRRPFYAVGKAEAAGTEDASGPVMLVIEETPVRP